MKIFRFSLLAMFLLTIMGCSSSEMEVAIDLKSESGHQLLVLHSIDDNSSYAAVSTSNMRCIIDILSYDGPTSGAVFSWTGRDTLGVSLKKGTVAVKRLVSGYKKCGNAELFVEYTSA